MWPWRSTAAVDVSEAVRPLLAVIATEAERRGATFHHELPSAKEQAWAFCDTLMLQRVLFNLAANSLDTLESSPFPHHIQLSVRVLPTYDGPRVSVRLRDNGPGFDPSVTHLMGPNFSSLAPDGNSLAMLLADNLCRQWGGELRITPVAAHGDLWPGSCVELFLLPATPLASTPAALAQPPVERMAA
jgi:C4-dicarboxylate-specific signal transduction histidine kinase